jgi:hypothetical protein
MPSEYASSVSPHRKQQIQVIQFQGTEGRFRVLGKDDDLTRAIGG